MHRPSQRHAVEGGGVEAAEAVEEAERSGCRTPTSKESISAGIIRNHDRRAGLHFFSLSLSLSLLFNIVYYYHNNQMARIFLFKVSLAFYMVYMYWIEIVKIRSNSVTDRECPSPVVLRSSIATAPFHPAGSVEAEVVE